MTLDDAMDDSTLVTVDEAVAEIESHDHKQGLDFDVVVINGHRSIRDLDLAETIASIDDDGMAHSADIMGWLGY